MDEYEQLVAEADRVLEERGVESPALARAYILERLTSDPAEAIEVAKTINLDTLRTAMEHEPSIAFMNGNHGVAEEMLENAKRRAGQVNTDPIVAGSVYAGRDGR